MQDEGDSRYWLPPVKDGKPQVLTRARKIRGDVVTVAGDRGGVERRSLDRPLEFYVAKGHITGRQYRAGKRLHALWESLAKAPYVQVQYREGDGGEKAQSFVPAGFGALIYREALYSITDERTRRIAFLVCCEEHFARECLPGTVRSTAIRQAMTMLRNALDTLAAHFKYE
jgi:hypothetical protein